MRYWMDHPEQYNAVIRTGILHWLESRMDKNGFEVPGQWLEGMEALVETIQEDPTMRVLYDEMMKQSAQQITKAEADQFGTLIDDIQERERYR